MILRLFLGAAIQDHDLQGAAVQRSSVEEGEGEG
ncbi:MAG: hypothetical protein ACI8TQ_001975 [Planctomycetota bacterium]|jgi:hypothetical protein